jgi:NADH-quinone oxidoreductase subunit L
LGVGAYGGAMFHLFTHAFFKALLFLGAGLGDPRDAPRAGHAQHGRLAKKIPLTYCDDDDRHDRAHRPSAFRT